MYERVISLLEETLVQLMQNVVKTRSFGSTIGFVSSSSHISFDADSHCELFLAAKCSCNGKLYYSVLSTWTEHCEKFPLQPNIENVIANEIVASALTFSQTHNPSGHSVNEYLKVEGFINCLKSSY